MGKIIVIEGTDGSGKATQTKLLCEKLQSEGVAFKRLEFPRYSEDSSMLLRMYLNGAFGSHPDDVNAYAASTFFAVDRYASYKQDWGEFYENGGLIVCDRYTTSNAVHQASKLPYERRKDFVKWLFDFEYNMLGIPAPDEVVFLDVPTEVTEKMMRHREKETNTHADIHEKDATYLRKCRNAAHDIVAEYGWKQVNCTENGEMLSVEKIHKRICNVLSI